MTFCQINFSLPLPHRLAMAPATILRASGSSVLDAVFAKSRAPPLFIIKHWFASGMIEKDKHFNKSSSTHVVDKIQQHIFFCRVLDLFQLSTLSFSFFNFSGSSRQHQLKILIVYRKVEKVHYIQKRFQLSKQITKWSQTDQDIKG